MKTLKSKKSYIAFCWSFLKNVPPSNYPTIEEIEKTLEILNLLAGAVPAYVKLSQENEEIYKKYATGAPITDKAQVDEINEANKKAKEMEDKLETQTGEIQFEDDYFNTFFQQFNRWGKDWFKKIDGFIEFRKDMNATNGQPKEKKEKK